MGEAILKKGDKVAANHLANEYKKFELKSYGPDYFQDFSFNVNSIEEVLVKINGKTRAWKRLYDECCKRLR